MVERFVHGQDRASGNPSSGSHDVVEPARAAAGHRELDRLAQLEEMAARTHERAAELYETWLRQKGTLQRDELGLRAHRHRQLAAAARSIGHLVERTVHGFEARVRAGSPATGKARHLVTLGALERLHRLVGSRIEECVAAARQDGASWAEIGAALRVTRQTAHERYRDRPR